MVMVFDFIQTACVIIVLSYLLTRTDFFAAARENERLSLPKLIVCVLLFVFLSLYGNLIQSNIVSDVYVDTRVLGISLAGIIFGSPVSFFVFVPVLLISFVIGGETLIADCIIMLICAVVSAICHKYYKKPDAILSGVIVGLFEIVHMILIVCFVRPNYADIIDPLEGAKSIVYRISFPMIVINGLAAILFVLTITDAKSRREMAEKQSRQKSEFLIASEIQNSLIPHDFDIDPRLDIKAYLKPAYEVGGDLYSYISDDRYFKFIIGDVSGKGISASIVMSRCETLFDEIAAGCNNPAEILQQLNVRLSKDNKAQMFVTAFAGVLDLTTGKLVYSNAGHTASYLIGADLGLEMLPKPKGTPLGIIASASYENAETVLLSGQHVFAYSDGVTDAENASHETFGHKRLEAVLSECEKKSAAEISEKLLDRINEFAGNTNQADDITMLIFGLNKASVSFAVDNSMEDFVEAEKEFNKNLDAFGTAPALKADMELVAEEIISNIIKYGYDEGRKGRIELKAWPSSKHPRMEISDDSKSCNPFETDTPVVNMKPKERPAGGMGIFLTKNRVKSHSYTSENGKNILVLEFRNGEALS